jgi:signal transduction histidine kinase/CheY-like chemotaxis protein
MKYIEDVASGVHAEQIAAVFRQIPITLAVNFVNAALVTIVLAPLASRPVPLPFFAVVAVVTAGRLALWLRYRRLCVQPEGASFGSRLAVGGALLTGLCWGIGAAVLFPVIPVLGRVLLTIVVGGMCAGAVVVNAAHLPTLLAFLFSASLPVAVRFLADGSPTDSALGAIIVVFAVALALAGRHLNRIFNEAMRLRFELKEANLRLQAEIAEHRATEEVLRQSQKLEAVGQLTGGIAHDFNNLMTVVMGNLVLASARTGEGGAVAPLLQAALHATERGIALIQRLLAFARKQSLDPRSLDLGVMVCGIAELLRRTLGPEIRLVICADPPLAAAHVDANQVELAILNLVINARDAMPTGGTVRICLDNRQTDRAAPAELPAGDYVVVSIEDDGLGMDDATLARAFDPFFTTKEVGIGSGLGLPMVKGFAVQSGGAVAVRSKPGAGTTVELWLPRAAVPPAAGILERSGSEIGHGAANLLLCDDDDDVRRFLGEFLGSIGYTVHEAKGGEAALRILENGAEIDLLIVDYAMPGMNGLEMIHQARRCREVKPLLITGHAGNLDGNAAGVPVLRKPFAPADLARRIAELLAT